MTFETLSKIIEDNNIPKSVLLMSDSGWECDPTDMDGVYYNEEKNMIIFTQSSDGYGGKGNYSELPEWKCLGIV